MKAVRKVFTLHIEYGSVAELEQALEKVRRKVTRRGTPIRYDRAMENTAIFEWSIQDACVPEYREEFINGQWCQIYQSKMNNNAK